MTTTRDAERDTVRDAERGATRDAARDVARDARDARGRAEKFTTHVVVPRPQTPPQEGAQALDNVPTVSAAVGGIIDVYRAGRFCQGVVHAVRTTDNGEHRHHVHYTVDGSKVWHHLSICLGTV